MTQFRRDPYYAVTRRGVSALHHWQPVFQSLALMLLVAGLARGLQLAFDLGLLA